MSGLPYAQVPVSVCKSCGAENGAASGLAEDERPGPGDISICFYCGHVMAFADDLSLRDLTSEEMIEVAGDPDLLAAQEARTLLDLHKETGE